MTSIRRWLLGWLIFGLAAACLVAGYGIFHTARAEASELFDYELRTVAVSLPTNITSAESTEHPSHDFKGIADDRLVIDIWDKTGRLVYHPLKEPALPRIGEGFRSVDREGYRWRVFGIEQRDRFVQVAQPYFVRDELALKLALRTLWPLVVLVPVTIGLVLFVVARGLAPIGWLSRALESRALESLEPVRLEQPVPTEIRPLVEALNELLLRLAGASQAQRTFVADAAHELRTPLTALKLQMQAAVRDGSLAGSGDTLARIEGRLNRIIHLAQQLLTMAREDAERETSMKPVSLRRLCELCVGDFSMLAETKAIDLGLELEHATGPADNYMVIGDAHALAVLLNNLLDNAIRHTPRGGRVDVTLRREESGVALAVLDDGPGIPEEEIGRVCDRFYRGASAQGQGSGLGLAIASRIARRHRAAFSVANRSGARGLAVWTHGLRSAPAAAS
ncbi:sensor kinase [Caballeronia arationis]|jgi:two-component system OmpR family sensor kinase|uniref:histidine kinase n=1 Tax=Caballeronia arationis TaxID=1777142 RepID=A0A7Z7I4M6_9BURK|nr:ATP-binding protein [Caballeronia arationis]SAK82551.1 sensor kinase [Caballeronia arationis]SOE62366.1 two-component system, OmpR family, sensor kinase [Caballeronia arationis]